MSGIALALILSGVVVIRGALKGLSPVEAFKDIYDRSTGGEGIPGRITGGGRRTNPGPDSVPGFGPDVERWRGLVSAHFPANKVDEALSVMHCESRGNPNAVNPTSNASGLFQHLPKYWDSRSRQAGIPGANIFDPGANVRVAAWLYKQSYTWGHWSCKPSI